MLITECICGNNKFFKEEFINNLEVNKCLFCGVMHQKINMTEEEYSNFYKSGHYCNEFQNKRKLDNFKSAYEYDKDVAKKRIENYKENKAIKEGSLTLDLGCGNGAFVDAMDNSGYPTFGVDLYSESNSRYIAKKELIDCGFPNDYFYTITAHDCLEHMINLKDVIIEIKRILKPNGFFIIDFPDFYGNNGIRHWKYIEHIWFLNKEELTDILEKHGFNIRYIKRPIESKFTFYCTH